MATNLKKYKRNDIDLLDKASNDRLHPKQKKRLGRKSRGLTERVNINFTKEEFDILNRIHEETGAPLSTIIRKNLAKSGVFNTFKN